MMIEVTRSADSGSNALAGQVVIVTGGAGGIGMAACRAARRAGAKIAVVDRHDSAVKSTLELLDAELQCADVQLGLVLDVRDEADMAEMARATLDTFGRIDALVACAGILRLPGSAPKPLVDMTVKEWDTVLDVNLKGTFLSNRAVLPHMIAQRSGQIINISSVAGTRGRAFDSAYCASKFAVLGLSESLAQEARPFGIKVHTVLPDAVDTALWAQNAPIPAPRGALPPERVADLILFLLTLPPDVTLVNPMISTFQTRRRGSPHEVGPVDAQ